MIVYKARPDDVLAIADDMRECDLVELYRTNGKPPVSSLVESYEKSEYCWVAYQDDKPVMIFGTVRFSVIGNKGIPWMIGTNKLMQHPKELMKTSHEYVGKMKSVYSEMENYVDAENISSIKWLEKIGFKMHEAVPFGINGELFHKFTWSEKDV